MKIVTFLLLFAPALLFGADVPLGHKDFLPTPTRPVGYLGDGSSQYPGATPVAEWDAGTGKNVLWRAPMPYYSNGSCILVGDRVFTMSDRSWLFCLDAKTGKELWRRPAVPQAELLPAAEAQRLRDNLEKHAETMGDYCLSMMLGAGKSGGLTTIQAALDKDPVFDAHVARVKKLKDTPLHLRDDQLIQNVAEGHNYYTRSQFEAVSASFRLGGGWTTFDDFFDARNAAIWVGTTFNAPVSDGTDVFVRVAGNGLACYNLDGTRRWITWLDKANGGSTAPIFLYGDLLYVPVSDWALVFDKRTGRLKTEFAGKRTTKDGKPETLAGAVPTGSQDLGHNSWGFLPWKYKGEDCFLGRGQIIRAKDATVAGKVSGFGGHAATVLSADGKFAASSKSGYGGKMGLYVWSLEPTDEGVTAKLVKYIEAPASWRSAGIAGDWGFTFSATPRASFAKLTNPDEAILKIGFDGKNHAGRPVFTDDRFPNTDMGAAAGKYAFSVIWAGQTGVYDVSGNQPQPVAFNVTDPVIGSTPFFQGGRMYLRTLCYLYCIGTPTPLPATQVTPAGDEYEEVRLKNPPKDVAAALQSKEVSLRLAGLAAAGPQHLALIANAPSLAGVSNYDRVRLQLAAQRALAKCDGLAAYAKEQLAASKDPAARARLRLAVAALGPAGKAVLTQVVEAQLTGKEMDYALVGAALPALCRADPVAGNALAKKLLTLVSEGKVGRWPSWNDLVFALSACDGTVAGDIAGSFNALTNWGKDLPRAAALVDVMLRADEQTKAEKIVPFLKAHYEGSLKERDMGKRGLAIWAYTKAGGPREPMPK